MARQMFRKGASQKLKTGQLITTQVVRIGGVKIAIQHLVVTKIEAPKKPVTEKKVV